MSAALSVLLVEDEPLTLDELVHQLSAFPQVREVVPAADALQALRLLHCRSFDAAFLDISMPGLNGMELATVLARLATPPVIVFVTASDAHAVAAYSIGAVDYLLKPIERERIAQALGRINLARSASSPAEHDHAAMDVLQVEHKGRIRFVHRDQVRLAEARGDYVRLHTSQGDYTVRMPLSSLEVSWSQRGFVRVHRGYLVALAAVVDLHTDALGQLMVHTLSGDAPVSRRHARQLKEQLIAAASRGEIGGARR